MTKTLYKGFLIVFTRDEDGAVFHIYRDNEYLGGESGGTLATVKRIVDEELAHRYPVPMKRFIPITDPYLQGVKAVRADGLTVEVVRASPDGWTVFLTRNGHVVACSLEEHRACAATRCQDLPRNVAMHIAKRLL